MVFLQPQVTQTTADQFRIRDKDPAVIEFPSIQVKFRFTPLAKEMGNPSQFFPDTDRGYLVSDGKTRRRIRKRNAFSMPYPAKNNVPAMPFPQLFDGDADRLLTGYPDGAVFERLGGDTEATKLFCLGRIINLPDPLENTDRQDRADDTHRIGDGISHDRIGKKSVEHIPRYGMLDDIEDCGKRRGIGEGPGKNSCRKCRSQLEKLLR